MKTSKTKAPAKSLDDLLENRDKTKAPASLDDLLEDRDRSLSILVEIWNNGKGHNSDDLNAALDILTMRHLAATFQWASGTVL
jgi:hypothetical protein